MKEKVLISWSGGKESALALYEIIQQKNFEIAALLTTVNEDYQRISMHGIRKVLLEQQAQVLGLPLEEVLIPKNCSAEEYAEKMRIKNIRGRFSSTQLIVEKTVTNGHFPFLEGRKYNLLRYHF